MDFKEKLQQVFPNNNIEIINFENEKNSITYRCLDCNEVYTYKSARTLFARITLCKNCYNPYARWNSERIENRLSLLFPRPSRHPPHRYRNVSCQC